MPTASVTPHFVVFLREVSSRLRVGVQFDLRITQLTEVAVGPKCELERVVCVGGVVC